MRFFKWFRGIFARRHGSCNRDARRKYRYCDNDPQPLAVPWRSYSTLHNTGVRISSKRIRVHNPRLRRFKFA